MLAFLSSKLDQTKTYMRRKGSNSIAIRRRESEMTIIATANVSTPRGFKTLSGWRNSCDIDVDIVSSITGQKTYNNDLHCSAYWWTWCGIIKQREAQGCNRAMKRFAN